MAVRTNLKKVCVRVSNDEQRHVALTFYSLCTGFEIVDSSYDIMPADDQPRYVGISMGMHGYERLVICADAPSEGEIAIEFIDLEELATTSIRRIALREARASYVAPSIPSEQPSLSAIPPHEIDKSFYPVNLRKVAVGV